jgi:hypothetical protein
MCLYWYYLRVGGRAADEALQEDKAAIEGANRVVEAVGGRVTQLVEDGGRLTEL